jgi:hypothetical protein
MTSEHTHSHATERPVVVERQVVTERPAVVHEHVHGTDPIASSFALNQAMLLIMAGVAAIILLIVVLAWAPWNSSTGTVTPSNNAPSQQQQAPSQQAPQQQQSAPSQQAPQ